MGHLAVFPEKNATLAVLEQFLMSEALAALAAIDPEAAELVQLRYFTGLTIPQAAEAMGISPRTALQHWQRDRDLASLRDPAELEKIPEEERLAWHRKLNNHEGPCSSATASSAIATTDDDVFNPNLPLSVLLKDGYDRLEA